MAITVSNVVAFCPFGRAGWVSYLVTRTDGSYAWTGAWVNGAYSVAPSLAADGTTRGTGPDGVYAGISAIDVSPWDVSVWASDASSVDFGGGDGAVGPQSNFSAGLDSNPSGVAEVATASSDSAVVSAATAAATADPPETYAVSLLQRITDSGGVDESAYSLSTGGGDIQAVARVRDGSGADTTDCDAVTISSSDPTVCTPGTPVYDSAGGGTGSPGWVTPLSFPGGTGTVTLTGSTSSAGAPSLSSAVTITVTP